MTIQEIHLELTDRLNKLQRTQRKHKWLAVLGLFAIFIFTSAIIIPVIAHLGMESKAWRWGIAVVSILTLCFLFYKFFISFILKQRTNTKGSLNINLALKIGRLNNSVRDRLANALQIYSETQDTNDDQIKKSLSAAALKDVYSQIREFDFEEVIDKKSPKHKLFTGTGMLLLCGIIWGIAPNYMFTGLKAIVVPNQRIAQTIIHFEIEPGDVEIIKNQNLLVSAKVNHIFSGLSLLEWQNTDTDVSNRIDMTGKNHSLHSEFTHLFNNIRENFAYRVHLDDQYSAWYQVHVLDPPIIRSLQLTIKHPSYTARGETILEKNIGDILALPGSTVSLTLETNKELKSSELLFNNEEKTKTLPLNIEKNKAIGDFKIFKDGNYSISLTDTDNLKNTDPISYRIQLVTDQNPTVQIIIPGKDIDLDERMELPLAIEANDDYGFTKVNVVYKVLQSLTGDTLSNQWKLPVTNFKQTHLNVETIWDLSQLNLEPEDMVEYYTEVYDNDIISGPKSARSKIFRARFPSLYEIYEDVASKNEENSQDLEKMYDQAQKAKNTIDEIVQELKKNPQLNWQQKQRIKESAGSTDQTRKDLQAVQERLDQMIDSMERNDLMSFETLKKYMELQDLMQKIDSPMMQKTLQELQKAMEKVDPEKMQEAMKNFQFSQEDFQKSIERTMNILKELQAEQKLDEALKKTNDLLARQEKVNNEADKKNDTKKQNDLATKEARLKEDTDSLDKTLNDLSKLLQELNDALNENVDKATQMMQENNLSGKMQKMSSELQQGQMKQAQQSGSKIANTLKEMSQALSAAQQEMQQKRNREVMQALQRSSHNLLQLSKRQEGLMPQSSEIQKNSPGGSKAAQTQQELLSALQRVTNQLFKTSQKSFAVTPEIAGALGEAMGKMQKALSSLEARSGRSAAQSQGQAMQGLNQAVAGLRTAMQGMSGSKGKGQGMGMEDFMQQMMGLSGKQQGINQQTQQLGQGGMSPQQQAAMARMGAQQAAVKSSLEQLLQEFANQGEVLGRLEQTVKDMEEVSQDLNQKSVNRQTIERQRQILSRMLDAQKSMRQREFSKKRQGQSSKKYHALDPRSLPTDLGERKTKIQEDLMRALQEKYSHDYKDLIENYFKQLVEQQQTDNEI